jgi:hypothetical protein
MHKFICTCGSDLIMDSDGILICPNKQKELESEIGLKSVYEWSKFFGIRISDPRGWDIENRDLLESITKEDFIRLAKLSIYSGNII